MQAFTQEVVAIVDSNGGSMDYPALYEAVAPEKRQQLRGALKEAKSEGILKQTVGFHPETGALVHTVAKVS
jgi:hypothetical protein